jgi:hypothetical protein
MRLRVYGIDDDIIVVEEIGEYDAPVPEGFDAQFDLRYGDLLDDPTYLGFSDGTLLRCSYDGMWHIVALEKGECKIEHEAATSPDEYYSDVVTLECVNGFAWIVEGKDMKRLSGQLDFLQS